jgi:outer membrane immunogenic protein
MKKVLAIAVALGALGASQVFAQAKSFEGFNVGANAEINHATMSASDGSSGSDHSAGLGLQANYNWALGDQFVLGLGAGLSTGHHDAGTYAGGSNASVKDRYSIDLMPGYAINNSLLVYGKLSAVSATALSTDGANTATVHGTGYGVGLRGLISSQTYWQAGLDTYRFNDVTFNTGITASLKNDVFSVGVGYKF